MRAMKDSGIEWIGEIPENWELNKIGAVYDERSTKVSDKDYQPLSVTKQGIVPQLESAAKSDDNDNRKLIKKNDFVINSRSDRRGSCGISEYDGSCSLINTVLKPRKNMCNTYYSYVFRSEPFGDEFYRWGNGIVDDLWSTKWSNMKRIYIPSPSIEEQRKIADYLDDKCAKIDSIVEKQQAVVEKLKEYKLSVITETVTKGLNHNVKYKDSGYEFIGKIPLDYETAKISMLSTGMTDGTHGTFERLDEGRILLSSKNVREDGIEIGNNESYISEEDYKSIVASGFPKKNDVLLCCIGASIGRCTLYPFAEPEAFQRSVIFIRANQKYIIPKFLCYSLKSNVALFQEKYLVNQSAQAGLYQGLVSDIRIVLPPLDMQKQIVEYIDSETQKIDDVISIRLKIVEKLLQYKKSLIYEVVTGKREV